MESASMSWKRTVIVAVIAVLAGAWYVWDQKRIEEKEAVETVASRLVTQAKEAFQSVELERAAAGDVQLVREDETWRLTEPVATRADETAVNSLIDAIDSSRKENTFEVADGNFEAFGLAEPEIKVQVQAGEGQITAFELGNRTTDDSAVYARMAGGKEVFTVPLNLETQLSKSFTDLRDKRVLPANLNEATTVTLQFEMTTLTAEKSDGKWRLREPIAQPADSAKMSEILRNWNNARASDFIDSDTLNLADFGLEPPALRAIAYVADEATTAGRLLAMRIGDTPTTGAAKRWAMAEGEGGIFQVPATLLTQLQPDLRDLRSKEIFSMTSAEVGKAIFNVNGQVLALERDSADVWHLADDPDAKLDQGTVGAKVSSLTNLQVKEYLELPPDPAETGLDSPNLIATLVTRDGATSQTVITGRKAGDADYVYARRGDDPEIFGVDWTRPGDFFLTRDDVIDRSIFDFDQSLVQTLRIRDGERELTLKRTDSGAWNVFRGEEDDRIGQVEGSYVTPLLYAVTGLDWDLQFDAGDSEVQQYDLITPSRELTMLDEEDVELGRLGQGESSDIYVHLVRGGNAFFAVGMDDYASVSDSLQSLLDQIELK